MSVKKLKSSHVTIWKLYFQLGSMALEIDRLRYTRRGRGTQAQRGFAPTGQRGVQRGVSIFQQQSG